MRTSLYDHGTKVLILDDITRLRMHREADQDALDLMRSLMSMHVTLVLIGVGIPGSGPAARRPPRPAHRPVDLPAPAAAAATRRPPRPNAASTWSTSTRSATTPPPEIAAWVEPPGRRRGPAAAAARATPGMLTDGAMPEYLFRRTGGIVGLLERLIEDGCAQAIDTGAEQLTIDLLDGHRHQPGQRARP